MQIVDDTYRELAKDRVKRSETIYPERGLIYDRDGELIVYNEAIYNLMVIPSQVKEIDTTLFCQLFKIDREYYERRMAKARKYSPFKASLFIKEISERDFASVEEYLYQFKGFFPEVRPIRHYPFHSAAHLLGFVGEVDTADIARERGYYRSGDHIGRTGVEKTYESVLRGERGVRHVIIDNHNRSVGSFNSGKWDTMAQRGQDITMTIDIDLQNYGEELMRMKKGSVVAIEPATGEILALISSPTYDPNLLVGRERTQNFSELRASGYDPMNNRALKGFYPPGSTFKPLMALIGLQDSAITSRFGYTCNGAYRLGRLRVGCHAHRKCTNVRQGIQHSCNAYFCATFKAVMEMPQHSNSAAAFQHWRDALDMFGLGRRLGIDLPGEIRGLVPTVEDYDKAYGAHRWKASTIISLGIGQDKLILTPLQQANMTAALANRGFYHTPHIVKEIAPAVSVEFSKEENPGSDSLLRPFQERNFINFHRLHFEEVVEGMHDVVVKGTGRMAQIPDIEVCGKTGTAENPLGDDHSLFIAFAPKENPQIAIAVVVENSGFGSTYAAPIAGLMIEKYLNGDISRQNKWKEQRMLDADLITEEEEEAAEEAQDTEEQQTEERPIVNNTSNTAEGNQIARSANP